MSIQRLKQVRVSDADYEALRDKILSRVLGCSAPESVYVIGSMVSRLVTPESDIDVVLIFGDEPQVRSAQKCLGKLPPLEIDYPVEYVFLTRDRFNKMKDLGGISFEANHHGDKVHG